MSDGEVALVYLGVAALTTLVTSVVGFWKDPELASEEGFGIIALCTGLAWPLVMFLGAALLAAKAVELVGSSLARAGRRLR